jgi:protein tyrosine/serine phosphatase
MWSWHGDTAFDISQERTKELAKADRELAGPIYLHCHHGKHRSPAAAVVACVTAGLILPHAALPILRTAGTSED